MNNTTNYEERDAYDLDQAGDYFSKHMVAMTRECLESKSDIACELGYRDMIIDQLRAHVDLLKHSLEGWKLMQKNQAETIGKYQAQVFSLQAKLNLITNKLEEYCFMPDGIDESEVIRNLCLSAPAHCLSERDDEIKAQAGREGFIAGVRACDPYIDSHYAGYIGELAADTYAKQLRSNI